MEYPVLIVDISGLFYRFAFGGATRLSCVLKVDGQLQEVDTTLPNYTIKQIHRWAKGGSCPTVICFDGRGCSRGRKAYFASNSQGIDVSSAGYKGSRENQDGKFYTGIDMTRNLLTRAGVTCLQADGFEADDLIFAAVQKAKKDFPNKPIHVVTGDADLAPLVDEQVSVFLYSRKTTFAVNEEFEKLHYFELRPDNFQDYMEGLTAYKNLVIPYNTILLVKCLRGDKSDDIQGYPKFTPTKYKKLISDMQADVVDFDTVFRYCEPDVEYYNRTTLEQLSKDQVREFNKEDILVKYTEPKNLTEMCDILKKYLDENIIRHIKLVYNGINLNCAFTGLPDGFNRNPAHITVPITQYNQGELAKSLSEVKINLPIC